MLLLTMRVNQNIIDEANYKNIKVLVEQSIYEIHKDYKIMLDQKSLQKTGRKHTNLRKIVLECHFL